MAIDFLTKLGYYLPTGTVFLLQFALAPWNNHTCGDSDRTSIYIVLAVLGAVCFLSSLTDTSEDGTPFLVGVCGFLWLPASLPRDVRDRLRRSRRAYLRWQDLVHGCGATAIYVAIGVLTPPGIICLFPGDQPGTSSISTIMSQAILFGSVILGIVVFQVLGTPRRSIAYHFDFSSEEDNELDRPVKKRSTPKAAPTKAPSIKVEDSLKAAPKLDDKLLTPEKASKKEKKEKKNKTEEKVAKTPAPTETVSFQVDTV